MGPSFYAGLAAFLFVVYTWFRKSKASIGPLPPGPKPVPILGNVRDLTTKELWIPATQWAKKYGEQTFFFLDLNWRSSHPPFFQEM